MADWFTGEGYPTYTLPWTQTQDGTVSLTLFQSPSHPSVDFFELPVPVRFNADMDTTVVLDHSVNGESFDFTLPFMADSAFLDPDLRIVSGQNIVTRMYRTYQRKTRHWYCILTPRAPEHSSSEETPHTERQHLGDG